MLTKKNLLVTHSVLRLCLESGAILLTSWLTVLTTLQHLCWVCSVGAKSSNDFITHATGRLSNEGKQQQLLQLPSASQPSMTSIGGSSMSFSDANSHATITSGISAGVSELSINAAGSKLGGQKMSKISNGQVGNGGVMGVVVDFVSCLSQGVMKLIETSVALDDVSLHHVINALTTLSQEAMEIAYSNRVRKN